MRLGAFFGYLAYLIQPKRVRIGYLNLKAAFGDKYSPAQYRRMIRKVFCNLGSGIIEMLRLPVMDASYINKYVDIQNRKIFDDAVSSGRAVILLTAHFGNWELSSITAALIGTPIVALARAQDKLPKLYELLVSYRESKGCRIVHKGGAMRQLLQALERKEPVGIVGDQASRHGIFVDFFGRPAQFATGPFELALTSKALLIPAFIYRKKGPFHRIAVEGPIELSHSKNPSEAVQEAVEKFASILEGHIRKEPHQWLWMHKRWKRTPARRVVILSDGKRGHLKQSLIVLKAMKEHSGHISEQVIEVEYRNKVSRVFALIWARLFPSWATLFCLRMALKPDCFHKVSSCYADVVISCGSSTIPVNVLMSCENQAKSALVMNPAPIPVSRFNLAIIPAHDRAPYSKKVLRTYGALTDVSEEKLMDAKQSLISHPGFRGKAAKHNSDVISVLIGGSTPEYELTESFAESLMRQVLLSCDSKDAVCMVTTSRRTPASVEELLSRKLKNHPRCAFLVLASRDKLDGTLEGMLGFAKVVVATGESISMVSESCTSGRMVFAVEPPKRKKHARLTKARRYLNILSREGYVEVHPVAKLGKAIDSCLADERRLKRLDTYSLVKEAVKRLL